jgi:hypothetical protein
MQSEGDGLVVSRQWIVRIIWKPDLKTPLENMQTASVKNQQYSGRMLYVQQKSLNFWLSFLKVSSAKSWRDRYMSAGEIRKKILVCVMVYTALGSIWKTENV